MMRIDSTAKMFDKNKALKAEVAELKAERKTLRQDLLWLQGHMENLISTATYVNEDLTRLQQELKVK
jgi:FtsZ-binding cell division protein ZapB